MPPDLLVVALILTAGVTLQTAVGFGLGLVCIPLLIWSGRPLPEAVAILIGAGAVQTGIGSYLVRKQVQRRRVLVPALMVSLGVPLGTLVMTLAVGEGQTFVKQAVGVMLLVVLGARAVIQPIPRDEVAPVWGYVAGGASGFLAGLVGIGGPPLALYALAHTWDKEQYRAFIWPVFFSCNPVLLTVLSLQFGTHILLEFAWGVALLPCVWLGTRAGMAVSHSWEMAQLQRGVSVLLYVIALSSIVGPLL